jgi:hypothetical protein
MELTNLFLGFALNLFIAVVIVRGIYYPVRPDKNFIFTYLAFSTVIYFVMTFLTTAELSIGVGFGLFAIFSVLRYRTTEMTTREMTYLFILIALPVMNSVLMRSSAWLLLVAANSAVIAVLYVLEKEWGFRFESMQQVRLERVDLVEPSRRPLLVQEMRRRTGLPITHIEVGRINYLDDSVDLTLFYETSAASVESQSGAPRTTAWRSTAVRGLVEDA